jgi:hypothetical protein
MHPSPAQVRGAALRCCGLPASCALAVCGFTAASCRRRDARQRCPCSHLRILSPTASAASPLPVAPPTRLCPAAGITIGSVAAVHAYTVQLLRIAFEDASPKCRWYGSDQAVHNYMLHKLGPEGQLDFPHHMARNWDSPVHTAGGWAGGWAGGSCTVLLCRCFGACVCRGAHQRARNWDSWVDGWVVAAVAAVAAVAHGGGS